MEKFKNIVFATVAETTRTSAPSAKIRTNGKLYLNEKATKLINYPTNQYFQIGKDAEGVIWLLPANAGTPNALRAAKNNDAVQFNNIVTLSSLGMVAKDGFLIAEHKEQDGDKEITLYSFTKRNPAKVEAEEKANVTAHTVPEVKKSEAEIKGAINRADDLKKKEAEAVKQAKKDFKAGK